MLKDNGGGHYITYSIENGRPWGPSGLFSLIPSWRTQTHHFLPLSVQSSHFLQLFLILNVQSHSASPAPAFLNSSQCVTERIFKSIKPILFKRQREFITNVILWKYVAIELLISCHTSFLGRHLSCPPLWIPITVPITDESLFISELVVTNRLMGLRYYVLLTLSSTTSTPGPRASSHTEWRPNTCWVVYYLGRLTRIITKEQPWKLISLSSSQCLWFILENTKINKADPVPPWNSTSIRCLTGYNDVWLIFSIFKRSNVVYTLQSREGSLFLWFSIFCYVPLWITWINFSI